METELDKIARILGVPEKTGCIMPFGKFMGRDLSEIKTGYLEWLLKQDIDENLANSIEDELGRKGRK